MGGGRGWERECSQGMGEDREAGRRRRSQQGGGEPECVMSWRPAQRFKERVHLVALLSSAERASTGVP